MNIQTPPPGLPPDLAEVYQQAAEKNVLAALNPKIYFGFFSVCADGAGHGPDNTFPGLDWGQSAEALLWLGRTAAGRRARPGRVPRARSSAGPRLYSERKER